MFWLDYTVESIGLHGQAFRVKGDWPGEVMGVAKDGTPKDNWLYKPGDVYIVDDNGWLRKSDHLSALMMKYEDGKNGSSSSSQ